MSAPDGRAPAPARRALLHLGMHKTGSTSIQQTFAGYADERTEYLDLGKANQSAFLSRCFDPQAKARLFASPDPERRAFGREQARARLRMALEGTTRSVILSGEDLWKLPTRAACEDCVAFLRASVPQVDALAYVRAPESYARTMFQQTLRTRPLRLGEADLVPPYRSRAENWIAALGASPEFVLFHRDAFHGGDLILDFAHRAGIDAARAPRPARVANVSLSAEATALLYLLRHADGPTPEEAGPRRMAENRLLLLLYDFGSTSFALAPDVVARSLERRAADIAWMEARLGRSFPAERAATGAVFAADADLLDLAAAQGPALREFLHARWLVRRSAGTDPLTLLRAARDAPVPSWAIRRGRALAEAGLRLAGRLPALVPGPRPRGR